LNILKERNYFANMLAGYIIAAVLPPALTGEVSQVRSASKDISHIFSCRAWETFSPRFAYCSKICLSISLY
jgi:hypothetical protein